MLFSSVFFRLVRPARAVVAALVLVVAPAAFGQTLAFPGAEGFGRFATGGRGGEVYVVTNLNDSGPGSLRAGVTTRKAGVPRTVVFAVSGTIYLQSTLRITQGNLTIAGQTAPGDGICLAQRMLDISNSSNVIIRFLRARLGDVAGVETDAFTSRYASNVIIDHCSFSWSVDETASAYDNTNFTMQWCFITESLRDSVHSKGAHGYGAIWGGLGASFHHNLLAHHDSRNPRFNGARTHGTANELVDMRNNVIYNWRGNSTYGGEPTDAGLPSRQNMVNNYYKNGPASSTGTSRYRILEPSENIVAPAGSTFGLFYVAGNHTSANPTVSADNWAGGVQAVTAAEIALLRAPAAFATAPVSTQTALQAYPLVLAYGGCRLPTRDPLDIRIVGEVSNGTATHRGSKGNLPGIIDSQTDVGGWPVLASTPAPTDTDQDGMPDGWESARGLNPALASDRNLVDAATGYTQLELYLNELAAPAFPAPVISAQPQSRSIDVGASATLSVTATGPGVLTYQWYRGVTLLPGAIASNHLINAAAPADAGEYTVVVKNDYGSLRSAPATVTLVSQAPAIVASPVSLSVAAGQDAVFTVVASGSAPLAYQWYRGDTLLSGQTDATLVLPAVSGAATGSYHVVVSNPQGSATSDPATLTVSSQVVTRVFTGTLATDTIHASTPVLTATSTNWFIMASKAATSSKVGDDPATSAVVETRPLTLSLNAATTSGAYQAATIFAPSPISLAQVGSTLRVTATFQPRNISTFGFGLFNSGGVLPHTVHHAGTATTTLIGGTSSITGGTQNWVGYRGLLTHNSAAGDVVHRLAQNNPTPTTNRCQDLVVPGSGTVSYAQPPGATVGAVTPSAAAISFVDNATYTLVYEITRVAADRFAIGYRVYSGTDTSAGAGTLLFSASAATSNSATAPSAVTSAFDAFAFGARTTSDVSIPRVVLTALVVEHVFQSTDVAPVVTVHPVGKIVSPGESFTLAAAAVGSPAPSFQWYLGSDPIDGATAASYTVNLAAAEDAGSYTVVATNAAGSDTSDAATVVVRSAYEAWAVASGLDSATAGSPEADAVGDGVPNLIKFALGGDPQVAGSTPSPELVASGAELSFAYTLNLAALVEHTVVAEVSPDLVSWSPSVHGAGGVTITQTPLDATTARIVVTFPADAARRFLRVRVATKP